MTDRITRVRSAGWLSMTDLAFHLGVSYSKAKEWSRFPDFPKPASLGSSKEVRWSKAEVDAWMENHKQAA